MNPPRIFAIGLGLLLTGFALVAARSAHAQAPAPGQKLDPLALQWPREFNGSGYEFAVYQPQISEWPGNQIEGRFAVAVRPAGTSNETYGVVFFQARTEIDKMSRLVTLEDFQITKTDFPTERALERKYQAVIQAELPTTAKTIPLDHLESVFVISGDVEKAKIQPVDNTPPRIIYTTTPSLLVLVDGSPLLRSLVGDYGRVINTRSVMLYNTNVWSQGYYLYAASNWYSAPSIEGPWTVTLSPPGDIAAALAAALATKQVDPAYPKSALAAPLTIYVATSPAELLQTSGMANLLSYANTDLLYVANSDNAIFYYLDDANYYVLISGRWFKSMSLYGPWTFVAPDKLPADFKKIPPDGPKANALVSVAGTPMAQEAVIANSIPQTATINRQAAKLDVEYAGAPSFASIPDTKLSYATNTPTPVISVNPQTYYACQGGVWFVSGSAVGPWVVATSVPPAIYTIPPSCPVHYVTYVYVYGSTATVVYVGYTPGYMGTVVAPGGVVVYGTGYVYPPVVVGTTYVCYPQTYGSGASFALGATVGFAFGFAAGSSSGCFYEPYWGCYHYVYPSYASYGCCNVNSCNYYTHWGTSVCGTASYGYNPYTGQEWANRSASTYNPYTGTRGTVSGSATYNPWTGQGSAARNGSWYNPYSGASAKASSYGNVNYQSGNYSGGRSASGYNPTTGRSADGSSSISGNMYNGNYNASRNVDYNDAKTGSSVDAQKSVSGNVYNGTASVNSSGTATSGRTGNSVAWNNGTVTSDKNGNTYTYNQGQSSANRSTAQSEASASHPQAAQSSWGGRSPTTSTWGGGASSWADKGWNSSSWNKSSSAASDFNRESWGQSTGADRFNNWHSSGGGGWGGTRDDSGGWDRGGGGGGGWGGRSGGGFRR